MSNHVLRMTAAHARQIRAELSRRHFLLLAAATAATTADAPASTHGPGWYTDPKLTGKVTMFTFAGPRWGLPTTAVVPLFKERFPKVEVDIITEPFNEAYAKIQLRAASHSSSYNTAWVDANQMTALNGVKALENFDPFLAPDKGWADDYFSDVPVIVTDGYRLPQNPTGQTYALTCDGNTMLMYYRRDLFERAGIKAAPETWTEALEVAKALHRPKDNQYGFVTTGRRGLYAGLALYQIIVSYGGAWFNEHWEPQFNTEIGAKALSVLMQLMKYAHPVTLSATDDEANAALANGTAVFAPMEWGTSILTDSNFTKFAADFEAGVVPRGETLASRKAPLGAGFGQYINTHGKDKRAAFEFIKHLNSGDYTDSRIGKAYVDNAGQPARTSLLKEYVKVQPYFGALGQSFKICVPGFPWIPEAFTVADQLGNEVTATITGEKTPEVALKAIDEGQRRIMAEAGYYK